ncbi:MAG: PAC2 family protein [Candidatus Diapherotrites archaeon]
MAEKFVKFVEVCPLNIKGYTLIEGFPGMGLVGTIAAKYLVEKMKFRECGYIDSNAFVPIIRIHKGVPVRPSRIYVNDEQKLAVLISEQIIPRNFTDYFARAMVEWTLQKGVKRVISLAGIHTDAPDGAKKQLIYGIAANEKSKEMLKKHELEIIEDGITTGVTALILMDFKATDLEAISIMGNVKIAADYEAAAELLKKLNEIIGLEINIEPLLKEAKETEKELLKQMQRVRETHETVNRLESKTPTPMYT